MCNLYVIHQEDERRRLREEDREGANGKTPMYTLTLWNQFLEIGWHVALRILLLVLIGVSHKLNVLLPN